MEPIKGFSKLNKEEKIKWLLEHYSQDQNESNALLRSYWHTNEEVQQLHDEFIENTLTNFFTPFGIAPNFLINGKLYAIPMAIEESSVVAAAAKAANFWIDRGGFKTEVLSTKKVGHVHFYWNGMEKLKLQNFVDSIHHKFLENALSITENMQKRGGGILSIQLIDKTEIEPDYYQLKCEFETCDSMGANFINSCLENIAKTLQDEISISHAFTESEKNIQIVMSILSNYTPECIVRAEVSCQIDEINEGSGIGNQEFAQKFVRAVRIAEIEPYRAVTHNKGIMNGTDAVVIATGNDFRATEACAHAYAARSGKYSSLTHAQITPSNELRFWIDLPIALGTVGGITSLHPLVKFSHQILGNPTATELMQIIASAGLAQNFSAIRSLITSGIQKGHMKMHLLNILNQLGATEMEKQQIVNYFKDKIVSHSETVKIFNQLRNPQQSGV